MRLLPFPFYAGLSPTDLRVHECSDRIVIPAVLYKEYTKPNAILHLENSKGESCGGVLHGGHDGDESLLFVPSWMFYRFTDTEVSLTSISTVACTHIQLRPSVAGALKPDKIAAFQAAFQNYKTLSEHTQILVGLDPPIIVTVELLHPAKPSTLLLYNVGVVGLTILPPKPQDIPYLLKTPNIGVRIPFVGQSFTLTERGDQKDDAETCRARMTAAAKNRNAGGRGPM